MLLSYNFIRIHLDTYVTRENMYSFFIPKGTFGEHTMGFVMYILLKVS